MNVYEMKVRRLIMRNNVSELLKTTMRYSRWKAAFLEDLANDLRRMGMPSHLNKRGQVLDFRAVLKRPSTAKLRDLMKREKTRRLESEADFLEKVVATQLFNHFPGPDSLSIKAIKPEIVFCKTKTHFDLFHLCRLLQSVPSSRLLYRQIAALVVDTGQPTMPIMGAIGLASPVYSLHSRDAFFDWNGSSPRKKQSGLVNCMQLNVCVAVPPYNMIRGAKLVAALAATDAVGREYKRRYRAPLLAITTTSAMGSHSAVFHRFMSRRGGLYRKVGQTSGYSSLFFSKETLFAAKALVRQTDGLCPNTTDRPIRALKRALNLCGLPRERLVRLAFPKGVYVAVADEISLAVLRSTARGKHRPKWPTVGEAIACWRTRELPKALSKLGLRHQLPCEPPNVVNLLQRTAS